MLIFNQALARGDASNLRNMNMQYQAVNRHRSDARHALNPALFANVGSSPTDLYKDFDSTTIRQFHLDEGDNLLNRLLPLARSLPIGRMVSEQARASGMGGFQTSMSGEIGVIHDKVDYDLDGTLVPVHQNGFSTSWREENQMSLDGFDDAMVKQSESLRTHRKGLISYIMDGTTATYKTYGWSGFRGDARVDQVDIGSGGFAFDYTDKAQLGSAVVTAFTALAERRFVTQKINAPAVWFVSNEVYWNFTRDYSTAKGDNTIMQRLLGIPTVSEIVATSALSGNEILSMVLSSEYIQPLVGMGVSTIALARPNYNSPFAFDTVSAMGLNIKRDFANGGTAVQFASE